MFLPIKKGFFVLKKCAFVPKIWAFFRFSQLFLGQV
jgi:hypothetical protein